MGILGRGGGGRAGVRRCGEAGGWWLLVCKRKEVWGSWGVVVGVQA